MEAKKTATHYTTKNVNFVMQKECRVVLYPSLSPSSPRRHTHPHKSPISPDSHSGRLALRDTPLGG